jgi:DNA-binding beta-propeller fold protein YncE
VQVGGGGQGVGVGFGAVWAAHGSDVARVDFASRAVTATIPAGKVDSQGHLVTGFGHVWALGNEGRDLVGIDAATNTIGPRVALGSRGFDVAIDERGVWVLSDVDRTVTLVDPETASVERRFEHVPLSYSIAVGDDVWLGGIDTITRLDPTTGAVTASVPAGPGRDGSLLLDGHTLWSRGEDVVLRRVDTRTARVVDRIDGDLSGGSVLVAFGSLWISAFDDGVVYRVPDR